MAIKKVEAEAVEAPTEVVEAVVEAIKETEVSTESVTARPVKIQAVFNKMVNPITGATYRISAPTDLYDFNAPDSYFERAQVAAGVLKIVEG